MRPILRILVATGCLGLAVPGFAADDNPAELTAARKLYVDQVLRTLGPIQRKYIEALDENLGTLTRAGNLDAALKVREEIRKAREWDTLPYGNDRKPFEEPVLITLFKQYKKALDDTLLPIQAKYVNQMATLQEKFTRAGSLDAALKVEAEGKLAGDWKNLPTDEGKRRYYAGFSKDEFAEWLQEKTFQFTGSVAKVAVTFDGEEANWRFREKDSKFTYTISSRRRVIINGGERYDMEFADDLQSGTLESSRGKYDLTISERNPADAVQSP